MEDIDIESEENGQRDLTYLDHPVSKEFRDLIFGMFNLESTKDVDFLAYLLFTSFRDEESGFPVVSRDIVADIYGSSKRLKQGRFRSLDTMFEFSARTGIKLTIYEYVWKKKVARTAEILLPPILATLLRWDLVNNVREVVFATNRTISKHWLRLEREKRRDSRKSVPLDILRPNYSVASYLNNIPDNAYSVYSANLPIARKFVLENFSGQKQWHQLLILNQLDLYFSPTYKQVANSERLFTVGSSAVYLSSEVRDVLFDTCWKPDLSNAHLVIAARLWGLEDVLSLIEEKGSIWPYLLDKLDLDESRKSDVKKVIYSTVYGMKVSGIGWNISRSLGQEVAQRYFELPLTTRLLEARKKHMSRIEENGFIVDAFGREYSTYIKGKSLQQAIRTRLAHEVGSYEYRVMAAAAQQTQRSKGEATLALWVHDGIYVKFRSEERAKLWQRRVTEAVENEAQVLGLPLKLVEQY